MVKGSCCCSNGNDTTSWCCRFETVALFGVVGFGKSDFGTGGSVESDLVVGFREYLNFEWVSG
ncbi:hypothetical protein C5167_003660 [Papaver somniferum]|uniref:Uncharacterized protein n=1 Tax=Papaver somniferum TaxID=3469 RepID=A0A4Y7L444_PAPSO|nr:hypothetical protein C5167_003660 [Papaver somniferum]